MKNLPFPDHFNFTNTPTPFLKVPSRSLPEGYNLLLKRDDMTGVELSGNKVRKLDFLLKDAVNQQATEVITCGGVQSNHCRSTAFAARQIGLKTTLVLKGEEPQSSTGNYFLGQISGAETRFITEEAYKNVDDLMVQIAGRKKGKTYIIPEGGSNEVGSWGYAKAFFEIEKQLEEAQTPCDTIVVATGSGGTHAGLLAGKLLSGSQIDIVSLNVCDNAAFFEDKIDAILRAMQKRYGVLPSWHKNDIRIIDGFVGPGYGQTSGIEEELIIKYAREIGVVFDPVYGIKAFGGMMQQMEQGKIPGKNILFIHTGGVFGVFPFADRIGKLL